MIRVSPPICGWLIFTAVLVTPLTAGAVEGFTQPSRMIEVATPESGIVKVLKIEEGDRVSKGQVVAILDNGLLEASLAVAAARMKATSSIEAAQARYEQSRERRDRIIDLATRGSARPDEVNRAKADAAIAVAELKGAREGQDIAELEYERLKTQIARRTVRSPIDGVVIRVLRERGELISGGQSVVAEIAELSTLHVVSHIAEPTARKLKKGSALSVRLPNGKKVTGSVGFIAPTVDPRSGTIEVKVVLANPNGSIRSGMRATLAIRDAGATTGLSDVTQPASGPSTAFK